MESPEKTIEELRKQAEEYLNGWKRAKADLINYQKQIERDRAEWFLFSSVSCVKTMLPVLDALQSAVAQFTVDSSQFTAGIVKIRDQMLDALRQSGVEAVKAVGEPVNTEFHEVVGVEDSQEHATGLIVKEAQRGYTMHGKVLRVAKVIVSE